MNFHMSAKDQAEEWPATAGAALKRFLDRAGTGSGIEGSANIQAIMPFVVFRSEFEYLIRDRELEARTLTELVFEHLARLLAVPSRRRDKGGGRRRSRR